MNQIWWFVISAAWHGHPINLFSCEQFTYIQIFAVLITVDWFHFKKQTHLVHKKTI